MYKTSLISLLIQFTPVFVDRYVADKSCATVILVSVQTRFSLFLSIINEHCFHDYCDSMVNTFFSIETQKTSKETPLDQVKKSVKAMRVKM